MTPVQFFKHALVRSYLMGQDVERPFPEPPSPFAALYACGTRGSLLCRFPAVHSFVFYIICPLLVLSSLILKNGRFQGACGTSGGKEQAWQAEEDRR
jgi:hypothetical protein